MIGKLTEEEIQEVLSDNVLGHLGCNDGFNTYVYPINYVFDGKHIIFHSPAGFKIEVMRKNKRVCLQVDEVKKNMNWKSVMVLGEYLELKDERERYTAMKLFVARNLHPKIKEPSILPDTKGASTPNVPGNALPVFYRIVIDEKSGRFEKE